MVQITRCDQIAVKTSTAVTARENQKNINTADTEDFESLKKSLMLFTLNMEKSEGEALEKRRVKEDEEEKEEEEKTKN
ncbi:hypothetical protein RRG08_017723 [Elysia crispata]|uniref:Uncharacterized protein n=1 Tax=Elysia crispata TaxID=231223 RepID=A0AAE1CKV4_9GAST|nr:hypothetical protein RRG08_017723 [Elysia crispata]